MRISLYVLFFTLAMGGQSFATHYYIDPTCSTAGDGATTTCGTNGPFTSWSQVTWAAGNTYSQKGGTTFNGTITVEASGTARSPITLNTYGTGYAAINGVITVPPGSWSGPDGSGVYSTTAVRSGYTLLEDGIYLYNSYGGGGGTKTEPTSGQFSSYWAQTDVYYHPTSGTPSSHTVQYTANAGIELNGNSYITISGYAPTKVRFGIHSIPASGTSTHLSITGNYFENIEFGIWLTATTGNDVGSVISNNVFDSCMDGIELYANTVGVHSSSTIANNTMTNMGMVNPPTFAYDWDFVDENGWDKEGIGTQNMIKSNIYNNTILGHVRGIEVYVDPGATGNNVNYYNNYIITSRAPIFIQPDQSSSATTCYANNIYYNLLINVEGKTLGGVDDLNSPSNGSDVDEGVGLALTNTKTPVATYNTAFNNTIYCGGGYGLVVGSYYKVHNNIIYGTSDTYALSNGPSGSSNDVFNNNLYYLSQYGAYFYWNNGNSPINWSAWQALGFDVQGLNGTNPEFTNGNGAIPSSAPWMLSYPTPLSFMPADFTLQSTSPVIGAGISLCATFTNLNDYSGYPVCRHGSIVRRDVNGSTVTSVDIGAYQYHD